MAHAKNSHDDDSYVHKSAQSSTPSYDAEKSVDREWEQQGLFASGPAESAGFTKKSNSGRWLKKNAYLVTGIAAGVLLLFVLLFLGWQFEWFGGGAEQASAVAIQPQTSPMMPTPPGTGWEQTPGTPEQTAGEQPKEEGQESVEEQDLSLPDDVSKWKKEDYFRARRENHPRLLEAIVFLGEKFRGSEPVAQGLTDLLKPLSEEPPPESEPRSESEPRPETSSTPPMADPRFRFGPMPSATIPQPDSATASRMPFSRPGLGPMPPEQGLGPMPLTPNVTRAAGPPSQAELTELVNTIIDALGANGTDLARETLKQIIAGTMPTDDDEVAVEAALEALVAHSSTENDALVLQALLAPESFRAADHQGPWLAGDIRAKTLELVQLGASSEMRAKLADALAGHLVRLFADDPIREFLLSPNPLNCSAQIVLYEKADATKEIKDQLEQQLADYSAIALSRLLQIPDEAETGSGRSTPRTRGFGAPPGGLFPGAGRFGPNPGRPLSGARRPSPNAGRFTPGVPGFSPTSGESDQVEVDLGPQLAGLLWSQGFRTLLESKLGEVRSFEREPQLMLLAGTIPYDSTRAAMAKLLRKRWNDGPEALEAIGLTNGLITDPGLLVLVKMLPRREVQDASRVSVGTPYRGARNGRADDTLSPAQKRAQAQQGWMTVSSDLVSVWCARFHALVLAKKKALAERGNLAREPAIELPDGFALDDGATVLAAHHVVWPDEIPTEMSDPKPSLLKVYYLRAMETGTLKRTIGFYSRQTQAKKSDVRTLDKATWLDSQRLLPQTDRRRSIDVLISREDGAAGDAALDDEETDLLIEVLVVEIKDPGN